MSIELNETDLMRQACMTAHDWRGIRPGSP
jgi:hypothetical protein